MSDVYVLGVDMIKFGRFPDRTVPDLGAEAALMALDDAGLNIGNMEAFYCGNLGQANAMVGQRILQEIGQTGIPVVNCANACATGATGFIARSVLTSHAENASASMHGSQRRWSFFVAWAMRGRGAYTRPMCLQDSHAQRLALQTVRWQRGFATSMNARSISLPGPPRVRCPHPWST